MRPVKLTMQGFTSFAEEAEVDFSDLDLFAITGPTGSGKTSILDAMTWALYGCTPRLGKCGAELISHGAKTMKVYFEFAAGTNRYRVARTAKIAGSGQVRLERWHDGAWIPEDVTGMRETSAAICKVVGLDFDAFKLSVILPQGEFDLFLRGDHSKRREILKSLLGLEVYDRMRDIAHRRTQEVQASESAIQTVIEGEYANANEQHLKTLTGELRQQKKDWKKSAGLLERAEKLCTLATRLEGDRTTRAAKGAECARAHDEYLKACNDAKDRASEVLALQQRLEELEREHDAIAINHDRVRELVAVKTRADQLSDLLVRRDDRQQELQTAGARLAAQRSAQQNARNAAADAEATSRRAEKTRDEAQMELEHLAADGSADLLNSRVELLRQIPEKQRQSALIHREKEGVCLREQKLREQWKDFDPQREKIEAALMEAKNEESELVRHDLHRELRAGLKKGQPCPVCEQPVSVLPKVPAAGVLDTVRKMIRESEKKLQKIREDSVRTQAELDGIPGKIAQLENRAEEVRLAIAGIRERVHPMVGVSDDTICIQSLEERIAAIHAAESVVKQWRDRAGITAGAARQTAKTASELDQAVSELTARVDALTDEAARLAADIAAIEPDVERAGGRERIVAELFAIEKSRSRKAKLAEESKKLRGTIDDARQKTSSAERQAAVLSERVRALHVQIEELDTSVAALEGQWLDEVQGQELPEGMSETLRASRWREQLREVHDRLQQSIASLDAEITSTAEKMERLCGLKAKVETLRQEREQCEQLHTALRADRFIDHLLTRAYQDLCARGSEHLLRLSGERYSFTAGKNTFCVKDAWNGDAERAASTLSGGESFFASLALALALAESVASFRADGSQSARLEALFLDEGVSSLDQDEALPAVIDALMNLQADDRMIGVISHMENLASRLPARIEILKNHGRSSIRMDGYPVGTPAFAQMT